MSHFFARKTVAQCIADGEAGGGLKRSLGPVQLTALGIGAIIGAGIFAAIGTAIAGDSGHVGAGSAIVISIILAGATSAFAALTYSEFAALIPISGSAYTYAYSTLGELIAWIIGWDLILEYAVGNVALAIDWAGYFDSLLSGFGVTMPRWLVPDLRASLHAPGLRVAHHLHRAVCGDRPGADWADPVGQAQRAGPARSGTAVHPRRLGGGHSGPRRGGRDDFGAARVPAGSGAHLHVHGAGRPVAAMGGQVAPALQDAAHHDNHHRHLRGGVGGLRAHRLDSRADQYRHAVRVHSRGPGHHRAAPPRARAAAAVPHAVGAVSAHRLVPVLFVLDAEPAAAHVGAVRPVDGDWGEHLLPLQRAPQPRPPDVPARPPLGHRFIDRARPELRQGLPRRTRPPTAPSPLSRDSCRPGSLSSGPCPSARPRPGSRRPPRAASGTRPASRPG